MSDFQKGDVVILKSGGPLMTVAEVGNYAGDFGMGPEDGVQCVWFEKGKRDAHVFDAALLKKVKTPD